MEETIDLEKPELKVYTEKAVRIGTLLGGPLVAGYLMAENFKVFQEPRKAATTWVFAVAATVIIFGSLFFIPESVKIPNILIPLICAGVASYFVQRCQRSSLNAHIEVGGPTYHWSRVLGISLVGTAITVLPIIGIVYSTDPIATADSKVYGRLRHEILFNKDNISEHEVDRMAESLTNATFFDEVQQKSIFLQKENRRYVLVIPVIERAWEDPEAIGFFDGLQEDLQREFPGNKIVIDLFEEDISDVKKRLE